MTLEEAMTDLSIQREVKRRLGKDHEADAIGLGIEALRYVRHTREIKVLDPGGKLLGETEEEK